MGFRIAMRIVGHPDHTYELVPILGLTYNGMLNDKEQIIPRPSY